MSPSTGKDGPIRTCLSCREKRPQSQLLRFALKDGELLAEDSRKRLGGRGVYCCNNTSCLGQLMKSGRRLARVLRKDKVRLDDQLKGYAGVNNE